MSDSATSPPAKITTEQLRLERESFATKLYDSRPETREHDDFERRFNEIEMELFMRDGGERAKYKFKHDLRHYFDFPPETRDFIGPIEQVAQMRKRSDGKGEYTLLPVDEVINWRNTEIGAKKDKELRRKIRKENLDDSGHLIGLAFGADPAEQRNVIAQNCVQNEWSGSWYQVEEDLKEKLKTHHDCRIRVRVVYSSGPDPSKRRGHYWQLEASGKDSDGKPAILYGNLYHTNPVFHAKSREEANKIVSENLNRVKNAVFPSPFPFKVLR